MIKNAVFCLSAMQHFGQRVAKILDWPLYIDAPVGDVEQVYIIGMYDPPGFDFTLDCTKRAKKRIIHWCGSDVWFLPDYTALPDAVHLCETEGLQRELRAKEVYAEVVTLPTELHVKVDSMPEENIIAFYFGTEPEKYGASTLRAVMDCLPDWKLLSYHLGQFNKQQMEEVIKQSKVYLRLTKHDGSQNSAREFLEAGKPVVVSCDLPYAKVVKYDDLVSIVEAIRKTEHMPLNELAIEYYRKFNSEERYIDDLRGLGIIE